MFSNPVYDTPAVLMKPVHICQQSMPQHCLAGNAVPTLLIDGQTAWQATHPMPAYCWSASELIFMKHFLAASVVL